MFGFSLFGSRFFGWRKRSLEVRFRYALERIKCLEEAQKTMADEIEGVKNDLIATNAAVDQTNARLDSIAGDVHRQQNTIANLDARIKELETNNPGIDLTEIKAIAATLRTNAESMALKATGVDAIVPEPDLLTIDHLPLTNVDDNGTRMVGEGNGGLVASDEPTEPVTPSEQPADPGPNPENEPEPAPGE